MDRERSLVGYSPWGRKESDTTERLHFILRYLTFCMAVIFFLVTALLTCNSYTLHTIYPFKVYNTLVFSIFTELWKHHYNIFKNILSPPYPLAPTPNFPSTTTNFNLFSVPMNFPVLDISYKWNHIVSTICDPLWLISFT